MSTSGLPCASTSQTDPARRCAIGSLDVSVVVPVYNPGRYVDDCIDSFVSQSLDPQRWELILVDDGSTDGTAERLDQLVVGLANATVRHEPNSGWPGRPRNVGLGLARGEFVFFCDDDDWLGPEALERMVAMARRTNADVLVPKMVGHGRTVPTELFRHSREDAKLGVDPLLGSLTPHKLFRRSFLDEFGLRFPEGRRRLEDQVFVCRAYLLSRRTVVMADYPAYHFVGRADGHNASKTSWDPTTYYRDLGDVIDVIEELTEPGPLRDELMMRPYHTEMLRRLQGKRLMDRTAAERQTLFTAIRTLALERFAPDFHRRLPAVPQARAAALIDGRLDVIEELALVHTRLRARVRIREWRETHCGWRLRVSAELTHRDGSPVRLLPAGDGWQLDPRLLGITGAAGLTYNKRTILQSRLDITVHHAGNDVTWYLPTKATAELRPVDPAQPDGPHRLVVRAVIDLDPMTAAGGEPLTPGNWQLQARLAAFGLRRETRSGFRVPKDIKPAAYRYRRRGRVVTPRIDRRRAVTITVRQYLWARWFHTRTVTGSADDR